MSQTFEVADSAAMTALGQRIATVLKGGDLVILVGSLGAGKTTLTQGIAIGLDVRGPVTSPTFVLAREHASEQGGPGLIHVDAYRINSLAEIEDLDLDSSMEAAVTVVEWGEGKVEFLTEGPLTIRIDRDSSPRRVQLDFPDERVL